MGGGGGWSKEEGREGNKGGKCESLVKRYVLKNGKEGKENIDLRGGFSTFEIFMLTRSNSTSYNS